MSLTYKQVAGLASVLRGFSSRAAGFAICPNHRTRGAQMKKLHQARSSRLCSESSQPKVAA